jgi:hypothetical protein
MSHTGRLGAGPEMQPYRANSTHDFTISKRLSACVLMKGHAFALGSYVLLQFGAGGRR